MSYFLGLMVVSKITESVSEEMALGRMRELWGLYKPLKYVIGRDEELSHSKKPHFHLNMIVQVSTDNYEKEAKKLKAKRDNKRYGWGLTVEISVSKNYCPNSKDHNEVLAYAIKEHCVDSGGVDLVELQPWIDQARAKKENELANDKFQDDLKQAKRAQKDDVIDFIKGQTNSFSRRLVYIVIMKWCKENEKWIRNADVEEIYQTYLNRSDLTPEDIVNYRFPDLK